MLFEKFENEEEDDLLIKIMREEQNFAYYYIRQVDLFVKEHSKYLDAKTAIPSIGANVFAILEMTDPETLNEEENQMIVKMKALRALQADGEEMIDRNYERIDYENDKMEPLPFWMMRNKRLYNRAIEVYNMHKEHQMEFRDSIFCPQASPEELESKFDQKLKESQLEGSLEDIKKRLYKEEVLEGFQDELTGEKNEGYIRKNRVLGEVLNRISEDVIKETNEESKTHLIFFLY